MAALSGRSPFHKLSYLRRRFEEVSVSGVKNIYIYKRPSWDNSILTKLLLYSKEKYNLPMFIAVYLNKLPIRRFYKIVMFIVIYNVFFCSENYILSSIMGKRGVYIIHNYTEIFFLPLLPSVMEKYKKWI